ncbi:hypothetical protein Syun_003871 [Stephania yunnanensis]|uniref:Uncharacterized protein n=1 Tax=Stephania yunnanensis TaxID=152371 RepID=A0AAP0Q210_9MAGN
MSNLSAIKVLKRRNIRSPTILRAQRLLGGDIDTHRQVRDAWSSFCIPRESSPRTR